MKSFLRGAAAAVALAGALAAPAFAAPDARIHFSGGSVGFIAGVNWGGGYVVYRGHRYPIQVSGLQVGAIGANSYNVDGEVHHLHRLSDIEGTYAAGEAAATAGVGGGGVAMTNGAGVEIVARSNSAGLKLSAGPAGVTIHLKH